MRTCGLIGSLLLISACNAGETQAANDAAASAPPKPPNSVASEPIVSERQPSQPAPETQGRPCVTQDGEALTHKLKAIGTEPFWAAEVVGRCVTYKTPEDQQGTRIWTHVATGPDGPAWNGALRGRQFQLYVKPAPSPGCSDGMSDKTYPLEAVLRVAGETRHGCAEQL